VPDALIDPGALAGTPAECREKIERDPASGIALPIATPPAAGSIRRRASSRRSGPALRRALARASLCYDVAMLGSDTVALRAISEVCRRHPGLHLAVVFGSRARGDFTAASDVDLAYLADERLDRDGLLADLVRTLDIERVDLVDLDRAGGLVRFRVARDGIVVFEARPDAYRAAREGPDDLRAFLDVLSRLVPR
jgi:predicted nucleotidyltransferase